MSADDVDFTTAAPTATPPAPADNFSVSAPDVPFATTSMYPSTPGWDPYTGWGRLDVARAVQWVAAGNIPPEAEIDTPQSFQTFDPSQTITVTGKVGAVRSSSYKYQVDVAPGVAPQASDWRLAAAGSGHGAFTGTLASLNLAQVAALFPGGAAALTGGAVTADGHPANDKFTFTIRVLVEDARGRVGIGQSADYLHHDPTLTTGTPLQFSSSIIAAPRLAPIGPNGESVLLVAEAGGAVHALAARRQRAAGVARVHQSVAGPPGRAGLRRPAPSRRYREARSSAGSLWATWPRPRANSSTWSPPTSTGTRTPGIPPADCWRGGRCAPIRPSRVRARAIRTTVCNRAWPRRRRWPT